MRKRFLAVFLTVVTIFTMLPLSVFADMGGNVDGGGEPARQ